MQGSIRNQNQHFGKGQLLRLMRLKNTTQCDVLILKQTRHPENKTKVESFLEFAPKDVNLEKLEQVG